MKKLAVGSRKHRAQRANQNELFKRTLNLLSDAVLLLDRRNTIIFTNSTAPSLLGIPRHAILGKPLDRIIRLEDSSTRCQVDKLRLTNGPTIFLGSIADSLFNVSAIDIHRTPGFNKLKSKAAIGLVIRPLDIATTANLRQNIIGQLTIRILHDYNNQLTSMSGNAELVQESLEIINSHENNDPETPAGVALQIMRDVVRKCWEMAADNRRFQDYVRRQPMPRRPVDINATINETLPFSQTIVGSRITIDFQPGTNLPNVTADQAHLHELIVTLFNNCKERAADGRATITVATSRVTLDEHYASTHPGLRAGEHLALLIADFGECLPTESLPKPAKLFTSTNGNGLHIARAYAIVKQLGAYIHIESDTVHGTRFQIYFPLTDTIEMPSLLASKRNRTGSRIRRAMRQSDKPSLILIAEDLPDIQKMMVRYLSKAGYHAEVTSTGVEALARFEALNSNGDRPALVIADLGLPGMDGRTLCTKIRALNPNVPVLLTSGHAIPLDSTNTETTDGLPFIAKPFKPAALLSRINSLLT